MKGLEEQSVGPPYWSAERLGGDLQDAVAADCKPGNPSHFSRYRNPRRMLCTRCSSLASASLLGPSLISSQKDIFGSEVNGFGKDK
jgi:hypothetical protein